MSPHSIDILLATFNGGRYLEHQFESVLQQQEVHAHVLARDDGSTDGTADLLQRLADIHSSRIRLLQPGAPTGSATANFRLLLQASAAPYAALADQDDVWNESKLARSLHRMRMLEAQFGGKTPLLVFTDLAVVDAALQPLAPSLWRANGLQPANIRHLGRLLGENVATGCTMLLNRPLIALAARMPAPPAADPLCIQHDHWIALLACTLGQAAWLPQATVRYRQHGGNVVGAAQSGRVLHRLFGDGAVQARRRTRLQLQQQASAFLQTYAHELSDRDTTILQAFAELERQPAPVRLRAMVRHGFWRGTLAKDAIAVTDLLR